MYPVRKRRQPARQTRERIMDAVRTLLEEGRFHESTVEEVAALAGVSRATLYQHFGSRVGLVDAMCDVFDANPALVAIRSTSDLDEFIVLGTEFWEAEEKVLSELYGVAAVDQAAHDLVERQRRDRHAELRRVLGPKADRRQFAVLSVLTSFETYVELRRVVGLSKRELIRTLQDVARQ
jgi:AcrR family transcriptional regulator